jgi:RHS repeat-associated protein
MDYEYDPVGTISSLRDETATSVEEHVFRYDGLYRLRGFEIRSGGTPLRAGVYTYDPAGNLQQFEDTQPLTLHYEDAAHPGRVTSLAGGAGARAVSYEGRGHVRAFGDLTDLEYDPLDRLTRVRRTDGLEVHIAYDAQSRRVLKEVTSGPTTTRVHYAVGLYERHPDHALRHVYLGNRLVATERVQSGGGGATSAAYYLSDHHGTILLATDAAGAVVHSQRYSPFGAALDSADALDRYLGRERDAESGLLHLGARYYAAALGRFVSPDWYALENPNKPARLPQGYNLYAYAMNNPLAFRDPSGMFVVIGFLIAAAVIAAYASAAAFAVGFVAGLAYGLANGQGWGSLLTALEAGLTTVAGMWLGAATGFLVGGLPGAIVGGLMGGMNGLISGVHGIYDWGSVDGWLAFLSDSTWGLVGTSLGNVVHAVNLFWPDSKYNHDLSHRQNRHVYEGGFHLKDGFAFTQGNVISNAGGNVGLDPSTPEGRRRLQFLADHEELHVWQSRIFGPLFQATYVAWGIGGAIVGFVVWLTDTDQDLGSLIETAAYYDNPFEYWAYNNDDKWPPSGANDDLAWG